jgi:hypothetical protein
LSGIFFAGIVFHRRKSISTFFTGLGHLPPVNGGIFYFFKGIIVETISAIKRRNMEVTAVVLYDSALAHYDVQIGENGRCTAHLAQYKGSPEHTPPQQINLHKEGRHWVGDVNIASLSDDIGYAIEMKAKPLIEERKRNGMHPAA